MEKDEAAEAKLEREGPAKVYAVPDSVLDDWTGTRFAENIKCYGKPCPSLVQLDDGGLEDETTPKRSSNPGSDPFDPNLADVDRIMDRYAK